jgi:hypothetical protein
MIEKYTGLESGTPARNLSKRATTGKYPPTPLAYFRKTLPKNNILIGDDPAQLRFLVQQLYPDATDVEHNPITPVDKVTDDMLLGHVGRLLQVAAEHRIHISADVRSRAGIWDAGPIFKGSAGANAIVRQAASLLDLPDSPSREMVDFVAEEISKGGVADIRGALWQAVWLLTGDIVPKVKLIEPWEDPVRWLEPGTNPEYRLQFLYQTLVVWGFIATGNLKGVREFKVSRAREEYLTTLKLDRQRVYDSIKQLSIWRTKHTDPILCALAIASIWC